MPLRFRPRYDRGLLPVLMLVLLLPLGRAGFLVAAEEFQLASLMLGVVGLVVLVLWSMLPRAFELWPDRISIVLGWSWGFSIPLSTITEVLPAPGVAPWARLGAMFATSFKTPVQIRRTRGINIMISPNNQAEFMGSAGRALTDARGGDH